MARSFKQLKRKMSPAARARADRRSQALAAEMILSDLRRALQFSQTEVADTMEVQQAAVSKLENRSDLCISTLRRYVEAIGGELEISVRLPGGQRVQLSDLGE